MPLAVPLSIVLVALAGSSERPPSSGSSLRPTPLVPIKRSAPAPRSSPAEVAPPTVVPAPVPPQTPAAAPVAPPEPGAHHSPMLVGAGAGAMLPLSFLRPGWDAGAELLLPLELLDGRLSLRARAGAFQMGGQAARMVPGRGYDPAFIQNRFGAQVELGVELAVLGAGPHQLAVGVAASGQMVRDTFLTLNAQSTEQGPGVAAVCAATYRLALGPGVLGVSLRLSAGAAALGSLAQVGTSSLGGASALLSYGYAFPMQENRR